MKWIGVPIILVFLLAGCTDGSAEIEQGLALRSSLLSANSVNFQMEIIAEYHDRFSSFTLDCLGMSDGSISFTVTEPESIAGIGGTISDSGGALIFDDTVLHFEWMADGQLSPVSAPWVIFHALRCGYIKTVSKESENVLLLIEDSCEDACLDTEILLDDTGVPQGADVFYEGKRILSVDVKLFDIL